MDIKKVIELYSHLSGRRKMQVLYLIVLTLTAVVAEIFSIGIVIPFLAILSGENVSSINSLLLKVGMENIVIDIRTITYMLILAVCCATSIRIGLMYFQNKLSHWIAHDIVAEIYEKNLQQGYEVLVNRNSSEMISTMTSKIKDLTSHVINPSITLVSYGLLSTLISCFIVYIEPLISIIVAITFGGFYSIIIFILNPKLRKFGVTMNVMQNEVQKNLQESFGGLRDVILMKLYSFYYDKFSESDKKLREATSSIIILAQLPKFLIEGIAVSMLAIVAFYMVEYQNNQSIVPVIGAIAVASQRLLPLIQQTFWSYSQLNGGSAILQDILYYLNQKHLGVQVNDPIKLKHKISFNKVSFKYEIASDFILNNVDIQINKGDVVGIIGKTGSGKSTFVDLLIGLIQPTSGSILIDSVELRNRNSHAWQENISSVPQDIYLVDGSIQENIALGKPNSEINIDMVKLACELACISEDIEKLEAGYSTIVGERGSRLSGGQKQRLGIARALYKQSEIVVFDEGTSALDEKTEKEIISNILCRTNMTIIMIAHRMNTLKNCDYLLRVDNNSVFKEYQK